MTDKERIEELERANGNLAKCLRGALMFILGEKNTTYSGEFTDDDGEICLYQDGGTLSASGVISGFGRYEFDFQEGVDALAETDSPFPKYGSAKKFDNSAFLQQFNTPEGARNALNAMRMAILETK